VIDLAQLDYVSSAGLRAFLGGAKRLKGGGGKIALSALKSNVKEVFDLSGFSSLFPIAPSVEGAVSNV
ncbi:STAS domain-containing protein, partial [bacterium]|nr:STAS domain-containing protein [bacterium]